MYIYIYMHIYMCIYIYMYICQITAAKSYEFGDTVASLYESIAH